jgi:hypothetical protein
MLPGVLANILPMWVRQAKQQEQQFASSLPNDQSSTSARISSDKVADREQDAVVHDLKLQRSQLALTLALGLLFLPK